jgi:hypothetical protein
MSRPICGAAAPSNIISAPIAAAAPIRNRPDWSTGKPDFDNPKVGVNARLFDDFDLDGVPVTVIDGKNLW